MFAALDVGGGGGEFRVEVYGGGPALSVCTLGDILKAAGVVRGLELDVNPAWVSGTYYHDSPTGAPKGFSLFPAGQVLPRALQPRLVRLVPARLTRGRVQPGNWSAP